VGGVYGGECGNIWLVGLRVGLRGVYWDGGTCFGGYLSMLWRF
jgi:hypothetical protein